MRSLLERRISSLFHEKKQISLFVFLRKENNSKQILQGKFSQNKDCMQSKKFSTPNANKSKGCRGYSFYLASRFNACPFFFRTSVSEALSRRIGTRRESSEESFTTQLSSSLPFKLRFAKNILSTCLKDSCVL